MSEPVVVAAVPYSCTDKKTVGEMLIEVAEQCARFNAPGATVVLTVPTPRGELVANVRIDIVQPLPRTH